MNKHRLNIPSVIIEHIFSAISMFLVFRLVITTLGISTLGLWSVLIAIFSLTSIGTSGFASSAVKFVSKYDSKGDNKKLKQVIETTFLVVLVFSLLLLLFISLTSYLLRNLFFDYDEFLILTQIFPYVLLAFIFGFSSSVYMSSLDGLKRFYVRSIIGVSANVVFVVLTIILIKQLGLKGLAIALMCKNLVILILSSITIKNNIKGLKILFGKFNKIVFKEIFKYGYQFQITSIFMMLMDPLTKLLLKSTSGGLVSVGYFEIVYKLLFHARQIIVVATNTVVPSVSAIQENKTNNTKQVFLKVNNITFTFSILILTSAYLLLPVLLKIVGVQINADINFFVPLIYIGLLFNLFSLTSFTFNLGIGNLKINMYSMGLMAFLNLSLSLVLGNFLSHYGVVLGWTLSQSIAALFLIFYFGKNENLFVSEIINENDIILIISVLFLLLSSYALNHYYELSYLYSTFYNIILAFIFMTYPIIRNSKFKYTLNNIIKTKS